MRILRLLTISTLTLLFLASLAMAQLPEKITAEVPFSFTVSGKTLPAGKYTVKTLTPSRLLIRGEDGREAVIASVFSVQAPKTPVDASLTFARYGDQYFLYQVFAPGAEFGRQLPRSEIEVQAAKTALRTISSITAH